MLLYLSAHVPYVLFQCEGVQLMLEGLEAQRGALQMEGLEQDVSRLKEWASGLTEKRAQLQTSLTALRDAVGLIEERTTAITNDFSNKVCQIVLSVMQKNPCRVLVLLPMPLVIPDAGNKIKPQAQKS